MAEPDEPGRRLDAWLRSIRGDIPKSLVQKLIRKGNIRVNGGKTQASYRLESGDKVTLPLLFSQEMPERQGQRGRRSSASQPVCPPELADQLRGCLVFEDESYIFLNKPSGLPVHSGTGLRIDLKSALPAVWPEHSYLELAHRLDKDASGCIALAKSWQALQALHRLLRERDVAKEYLAIIHLPVEFAHGRGAQSSPLTAKERRGLDKRQWTISEPLARPGGKALDALSHISIEERLDNADLARVRIDTGRHHQIRLHLAQERRPIVGDQRYGLSGKLEKRLGLTAPRLLLHAHRIAFTTDREYRVECPLPEEMSRWIAAQRRG